MTDRSAIEQLIARFARLPGLGPRSARRAVLYLLQNQTDELAMLLRALHDAEDKITSCSVCAQLDAQDPCHICADAKRETRLLCVVERQSDLWALERAGTFKGRYHVLGGALSALDGATPATLNLGGLKERCQSQGVEEVILAMSATVEGQATAHYITDLLKEAGVQLTRLAHGVPIGGELDYLDAGTLSLALEARTPFGN